MHHYFTDNDDLKSALRPVEYVIDGIQFTLVSDRGVFSKNTLDQGSATLIKALLFEDLQGSLLDLGSGIVIIGLTLAKLKNNLQVTLLEINRRALDLSKKNAEILSLSNVDIRYSDCYQAVAPDEKFTVIVTNPPIRAGKKTVYEFLGGSRAHLLDNGRLYFVMRKSHGALSAARYVEEVFGNCQLIKRHQGYYIYRAINVPSSTNIKK